jgi:hypothetical protein
VGKIRHSPVPVDSTVRLTPTQAAALIRVEFDTPVSGQRFRRWCADGKVPSIQDPDGEYWVLPADVLAAFQAVES